MFSIAFTSLVFIISWQYIHQYIYFFFFFFIYDDKTHYNKKKKSLQRQISSIPGRHDKHDIGRDDIYNWLLYCAFPSMSYQIVISK